MTNPKSSTIPKAAQQALDKKAQQMAKGSPNDKSEINTGRGQRASDVKNDARSAYESPGSSRRAR